MHAITIERTIERANGVRHDLILLKRNFVGHDPRPTAVGTSALRHVFSAFKSPPQPRRINTH